MKTIKTIEEVLAGEIVTQDGEYAVVNETNGTLWYGLKDEAELSDSEKESAIHVCDMDEEHYSN